MNQTSKRIFYIFIAISYLIVALILLVAYGLGDSSGEFERMGDYFKLISVAGIVLLFLTALFNFMKAFMKINKLKKTLFASNLLSLLFFAAIIFINVIL